MLQKEQLRLHVAIWAYSNSIGPEQIKESGYFTQEFTLGARGFSCAVSGVGHVSIVTRAKNLWSRARFL